MSHRAGFVSIVGKPNVGKSTLMNALVGERLSIITDKAQTTRHRIFGILNGEDYQIVYSDTPGIIAPKYELHRAMMRYVSASLEDADLVLFVTEVGIDPARDEVAERLEHAEAPVLVLLNKVDLADEPQVKAKIAAWQERLDAQEVIPISALHGFNTQRVFDLILAAMPEHPPYFPKDQISDRPERFFAAEMVREKIFLNYQKEVPYSSEVRITDFQEEEDIIRMRAEIIVERDSQKGILIGHQGKMLKKVGTQARQDLEAFFGKKVFLQQQVKVEPNWRSQRQKLDRFGYDH